jgi:hypothetical protein
METKGRRPPRTSATATTPVVMPELVETPADAPAFAVARAEVSAADPPPSAEAAKPDEIGRFGRETMAALAESQAAVARGLEAMSDEMAGLTRSSIDIAARTATEMLRVKTLSDALKVNALFARNSLDSLLDGSAKLSGLGVKLAAESSRPILTQLGQGWIKAVRLAL